MYKHYWNYTITEIAFNFEKLMLYMFENYKETIGQRCKIWDLEHHEHTVVINLQKSTESGDRPYLSDLTFGQYILSVTIMYRHVKSYIIR